MTGSWKLCVFMLVAWLALLFSLVGTGIAARRYLATSNALKAAMMIGVVVAASFFGVRPAQAAVPDPAQDKVATAVLSNIAAHTTDGSADANLTFSQMEAKMAAGGVVSALCGDQAILGVRALLRVGIPARLVAAETLDPAIAYGSGGHTLLEAYLDGRWQVYDLYYNVKPVTPGGGGLSIEALVNLVTHHLPLSFHRLTSDREPQSLPTASDASYGGESPYEAVMQMPLIYDVRGRTFMYETSNPEVRSYMHTRFLTNHYAWLPGPAYRKFAENGIAYTTSVLNW